MLLVEYTTSCVASYRPASSYRRPASSVSTSSKSQRSRSQLARQRKMTRSAPPARTSAPAKHISSTRARKKQSSADTISISIDDIYQSAERQRLDYSSACRRQNLAHAQSQTQFFRNNQSVASRPNTSASRHLNSYRRDDPTSVTAWSEPMISRPNSIIPHPELRELIEDSESDDDFDFEMNHHSSLNAGYSPISKDCCEIIGPQMCYECRKNRIRQVSRERSQMCFPILDPSEDNLTTAAIVRKYLPGLSDPEIENKLARGEIARPSIRRQNNKVLEFSDEEDEPKPKITNKKVTIADGEHDRRAKSATVPKTSELFFANIRDLNSKIINGSVDRNVGFTKSAAMVPTKKKVNPPKNYFPTFVSPRKVQLVRESNYKTYFEPPLIAKEKQDVEPAFFAGSKGEYVLPEKLPDELVFVDKDGHEVKASSSNVFTSRQSVSSEGQPASAEGSLSDDHVDTPADTLGGIKEGLEHDLTILNEDEEEETECNNSN